MLNLFLQAMQKELTHKKVNSFLLGFSGGLDSTVLLKLFSVLQQTNNRETINLQAIHIHHGLSLNADSWSLHCQRICETLKIPFIVEKINFITNNNIEANAREARYKAIKPYITKNNVFVTAHHLDDQVETFFLALKRGSGPKGLSGLKKNSMVYDVPIYRPLLNFTRKQLEEFAAKNNLAWIEDESNLDVNFDRNFIRHHVMPVLANKWPEIKKTIVKSANNCAQQENLLQELLQETLDRLIDNDGNLNITDFQKNSKEKQQQLIRFWLDRQNILMPSSIQIKKLLENVVFARPDANPKFKLSDIFICRYLNKIYLTQEYQDISNIIIECHNTKIDLPDNLGEIIFTETANNMLVTWIQTPKGKQEFLLPKPQNAKITIKFKHQGTIKLSGKRPHQKLKHLFQDAKIPVWERTRTPFIFYDDHLIAALRVFIL